MAIEFNEPYALFNLAVYYEEIEKNYEEMKKMAEKTLTFGTNEEVKNYVIKTIKGESK